MGTCSSKPKTIELDGKPHNLKEMQKPRSDSMKKHRQPCCGEQRLQEVVLQAVALAPNAGKHQLQPVSDDCKHQVKKQQDDQQCVLRSQEQDERDQSLSKKGQRLQQEQNKGNDGENQGGQEEKSLDVQNHGNKLLLDTSSCQMRHHSPVEATEQVQDDGYVEIERMDETLENPGVAMSKSADAKIGSGVLLSKMDNVEMHSDGAFRQHDGIEQKTAELTYAHRRLRLLIEEDKKEEQGNGGFYHVEEDGAIQVKQEEQTEPSSLKGDHHASVQSTDQDGLPASTNQEATFESQNAKGQISVNGQSSSLVTQGCLMTRDGASFSLQGDTDPEQNNGMHNDIKEQGNKILDRILRQKNGIMEIMGNNLVLLMVNNNMKLDEELHAPVASEQVSLKDTHVQDILQNGSCASNGAEELQEDGKLGNLYGVSSKGCGSPVDIDQVLEKLASEFERQESLSSSKYDDQSCF